MRIWLSCRNLPSGEQRANLEETGRHIKNVQHRALARYSRPVSREAVVEMRDRRRPASHPHAFRYAPMSMAVPSSNAEGARLTLPVIVQAWLKSVGSAQEGRCGETCQSR